ncbi:MAG: SRPBCC family protein [Dehalococcoidia bacterium]|nr:SRPBCC family protein [Dehalococcoidia bacterium]
MSKFSVSLEVDKPIQHCWDILMDESRMAEWAIGFQSIETIEGEPMTVGSKHRMVFEERGKELVFIETVKVIDPPREFTFDLDHEVMNSTVSMTCESVGVERTLLSSHTEGRPTKLLLKIMMPFMVPQMKRRQFQQLENLKAITEAS